ncbi:hypothetical protein AX15_006230 [Amanita polypyramis BW_CC]|nr:hypothetical protein AX15_006230 [Amanita polypyramis BW_CC]
MYGRTWVLHISNLFTMVFTIGCAYSPTVRYLITFRFLSGLTGAAPIAIGGGSISDLYSERDRASAMAIYSGVPLIGPALGPVAGGFIAQAVGVKYVFLVVAVICGLASILGIPILRETYAPVLQIRNLRKYPSDPEKAARLRILLEFDKTGFQILRENLVRPTTLLTCNFICFILSLYMALYVPVQISSVLMF